MSHNGIHNLNPVTSQAVLARQPPLVNRPVHRLLHRSVHLHEMLSRFQPVIQPARVLLSRPVHRRVLRHPLRMISLQLSRNRHPQVNPAAVRQANRPAAQRRHRLQLQQASLSLLRVCRILPSRQVLPYRPRPVNRKSILHLLRQANLLKIVQRHLPVLQRAILNRLRPVNRKLLQLQHQQACQPADQPLLPTADPRVLLIRQPAANRNGLRHQFLQVPQQALRSLIQPRSLLVLRNQLLIASRRMIPSQHPQVNRIVTQRHSQQVIRLANR